LHGLYVWVIGFRQRSRCEVLRIAAVLRSDCALADARNAKSAATHGLDCQPGCVRIGMGCLRAGSVAQRPTGSRRRMMASAWRVHGNAVRQAHGTREARAP